MASHRGQDFGIFANLIRLKIGSHTIISSPRIHSSHSKQPTFFKIAGGSNFGGVTLRSTPPDVAVGAVRSFGFAHFVDEAIVVALFFGVGVSSRFAFPWDCSPYSLRVIYCFPQICKQHMTRRHEDETGSKQDHACCIHQTVQCQNRTFIQYHMTTDASRTSVVT